MKKMFVLLMVGIMGMHLLPHAAGHAGGEVFAGGECRADVCDKKQAVVKARKEEERVEFEEAAMEAEQIAFDYGGAL